MPFDRAAAIAVLRRAIADAPRIDLGGGALEVVVNCAQVVEDMIRAADPAALTVPAYDAVLAEDTWHPLTATDENGPRPMIRFTHDHQGHVTASIRIGDRITHVGSVHPSVAGHLALSAYSAAQAALATTTQQEGS